MVVDFIGALHGRSNCSGLVAGLFAGIIIEWFWSDPWGSEYLNLWPVIGAFVGFLSAECRSSSA